jgi:hypothetical protein
VQHEGHLENNPLHRKSKRKKKCVSIPQSTGKKKMKPQERKKKTQRWRSANSQPLIADTPHRKAEATPPSAAWRNHFQSLMMVLRNVSSYSIVSPLSGDPLPRGFLL